MEMATIGLAAAQTLMQIGGARQQAASDKNALAVRQSQQRLEQAEAERQNQERLRQTLASQNNLFGAAGINPATGSALALQNAEYATAARQTQFNTATTGLTEAGNAITRQRIGATRTRKTVGALLNFGSAAVSASHSASPSSAGKLRRPTAH